MDGGMGTMIQRSGVDDYDIPEDCNIEHPEVIKDIYKQYLDAGSNVITANTFGVLPLKLSAARYTTEQYMNSASTVLKEAIKDAEAQGNNRPHYMGWDTSQIGRLLEPMGDLTFDQAYDCYKEAAVLAEKAGFEIAIVETMADLHEVKAAILAIRENTIPTAPEALVPSFDTKYVSAIL